MGRSDAELLRSAAAGDVGAFSDLVLRHEARVHAFAIEALDDPNDADDVVQETFIEAYRHATRFDGRPNAAPWLLGIAANLSRACTRRRSRSEASLDSLSTSSRPGCGDALLHDGGEYEPAELHLRIRGAIRGLPPKYRLALVLRFQQDLTEREIAGALGISRSGVAMRIQRGLAMLRERMAHLGDDEGVERV